MSIPRIVIVTDPVDGIMCIATDTPIEVTRVQYEATKEDIELFKARVLTEEKLEEERQDNIVKDIQIFRGKKEDVFPAWTNREVFEPTDVHKELFDHFYKQVK